MEVYIKRGEDQFGPFSLEQIEESLKNGSLIEGDIAWREGLPDWVPVNEIVDSPNDAAKPAEETVPAIPAPVGKSGGSKKIVLAAAAAVVVLGAAAAIVLPKVLGDKEDENLSASSNHNAQVNSGAIPLPEKPSMLAVGTSDKTGGLGASPLIAEVPQPVTLPVIPSAASPEVVGDSTTSFAAVTKHLDIGGTFFFYLSAQQVQGWMQSSLGEGGKLLGQFAQDLGPDAQMAKTGLDVVKSLYTETGLASIDGIGASTKEIEDGIKRNVAMIHHDPARRDGILWKAFGSAPHDITAMKLMPSETAYAVHGDLDLAAIQAWLKMIIAKNAPDLVPMVDEQLQNLLWKNILGSYGGEVGFYITFDPNKTFEMPISGLGGLGQEGIGNLQGSIVLSSEPKSPGVGEPSLPPLPTEVGDGPVVPPGINGQNIKLPQPGLILTLKVRNDDLLTQIQKSVSELGLPVESGEVSGVTVHQLPQMAPLPFPLQPVLFKLGDYLIIASGPELAAKVIAVHTGADLGLAGAGEFQKLARGMEIKGNQFSYVSSRVSELFGNVIKQSLDASGGEMIPAPLKELLVKFSTIGMSGQVSIMQVTPEGYLIRTQTEGMGYDTAASVLGAGVPILMGASLAVPAFIGGGFAAEEDPAVVMEEKFSQGRTLATGLTQVDQINGQLPEGKMWCDETLKHVLQVKHFLDPNYVDPDTPNEKISTWIFNNHLSGVKLNDLPDRRNTVLLFDGGFGWNEIGNEKQVIFESDKLLMVFADGHVENITAADLPRLKWKP